MANLAAELKAIREAAAVFPLGGEAARFPDQARGFLRISGGDATRWLNGMVTNSVPTLAPGEGCYNFLLNSQGRIEGDCTVYRETAADAAEYLLETDGAQVEAIRKHLDHFIIMDDVELVPVLEDQSSLLLVGPKAAAILQALGLPAPEPLRLVHADSRYGPVLLLTPALVARAQGAKASEGACAQPVPRFEIRSSAAVAAALHAEALAAGAVEISPEAVEALRILEARPRFGQDIRNSESARDLPQETGQRHALHFSKGCYLGQEIVERINSRGQVHREFATFTLTPEAVVQGAEQGLPALPAELQANGKAAGTLTSAAVVPLGEGNTLLGLGYVRREYENEMLSYSGGIARVRKASKELTS